jgi:hypothetical protein
MKLFEAVFREKKGDALPGERFDGLIPHAVLDVPRGTMTTKSKKGRTDITVLPHWESCF